MAKSCHGVGRKVTLVAGQLLTIEPQSVGERVQKDEATAASQLTFNCKQQKQILFPRAFLHPQPPARRGRVQDELLGARCPLGQAVSRAGRWPQRRVAAGGRWGRSTDRLSVSQRICWLKRCFSLSARRPATLSDCPRDRSTASPYDLLPSEDTNFHGEFRLLHL